jgi:ribonuclease Z
MCDQDDPLVIMAPPNMIAFLSEYQSVVPEIKRSYIAVDSRDMRNGFASAHPMAKKLFIDLGITQCISVPVAHCRDAFAIVLDGTSFGRVAYSGDCRPSTLFAAVGRGADLLIHEATFEDGMEEEAVLKRHSTVGEAIGIAIAMDAKALVLTHFSQRYPKIPPLNKKEQDEQALRGMPIAFAFDFMRLHRDSMPLASKLTPALRLLYPSDAADEDTDDVGILEDRLEDSGPAAKDLMSVPGVFAAKGIL